MNKILEIGSRKSRGGKRSIAIVLHGIPSDVNETNENGIHWSEKNTQRNIETVKGIPICAEFASDEKEVPVGHGYTSTEVIDGLRTPLFENSDVCGYIDHGEIRTVEVNGATIRALVGVGYLYEQRYPRFVKWVRDNVETSSVDTSVEIVGYEENDNKIIYESNCECSEDYRCPRDYQYSGTAIISVRPADSNAKVLECAQAANQAKEDTMTEKEIMDAVKAAISEANAVTAEHENAMQQLNDAIAEKDAKIEELNTAVAQAQQELENLRTEQASANEELGQLRAEKRLAELNTVLEGYTEEEQKYAESEINAFKADPMSGDIDAIKSKICVSIVDKRNADAKVTEQNATQISVEDIFGEVDALSEEDDVDTNIF